VLGREAMQALEKATTSTAWGTLSAVMKGKLADAVEPHRSRTCSTVR